MSRKISTLLLALVLVFSVTLCAGAAQSNAGLNVEAQHRGDEILVTVSVYGGQGITNGRIALSYDPEMVVLTDVRALVPCGEASCSGVLEERMERAALGPTPETPMSISKQPRSLSLENPYSSKISSRTYR